jgi:hypothetical protein
MAKLFYGKFEEWITHFQVLCGEHLIDPNVALENERIKQSFRDTDLKELEAALREEF